MAEDKTSHKVAEINAVKFLTTLCDANLDSRQATDVEVKQESSVVGKETIKA